jgi:hypothetical protein
MQILTKPQLEELEKQFEKKFSKKLEAEKQRVKSLRKDVTSYKKVIKKQEQAAKDTAEKHEIAVDKLKRRHELELEKKDTKIDGAEAKVGALKERLDGQKKVATQLVDLENRESILAAREQAQGKTADAIKDITKKAEASEEFGYKKGYGDGVADGLREAHKITAEDRRMAMQIAALSAASHTPGAATKLAEKVLNDVTKQLASGKDDKA